MAYTTAKLSELPFLHNSVHLRSHFLLLKPFCSTSTSPSASLRTRERDGRRSHKNLNNKSTKTSGPSAPWLNKWPAYENPQQDTRKRTRPPPEKQPRKEEDRVEHKYFDGNKGKTSIERIVHRLRNLGLDSEAEDGIEDDIGLEGEEIEKPLDGDEKLGDLLQRNWSRPDMILDDDDDEEEQNLLPWERDESEREEEENGKSRRARAPSLAELTIEDVELRRLRTLGMRLKDRINVAKAGVTQLVLEKIHDKWRKEELVRLKFHESLAHDMKTAHQIVEENVMVERNIKHK